MATPSILMWEKVLPKPPQSQDINIDGVVHRPGRAVRLGNGNGILTEGLEANMIAEYGHGCLAARRTEAQANRRALLVNMTRLRRTWGGGHCGTWRLKRDLTELGRQEPFLNKSMGPIPCCMASSSSNHPFLHF